MTHGNVNSQTQTAGQFPKILSRKKRKEMQAKKREEDRKRTLEKGKIVERLQAASSSDKPLPAVAQVPKARKKEDPEGYAKYQAYVKYRHELLKRSRAISPEDTENWLCKLIDISVQDKESQYEIAHLLPNREKSHRRRMEQIKKLEDKLKNYNEKLENLILKQNELDEDKISKILERSRATKAQIDGLFAQQNRADRKADFKRRLDISDVVLAYLVTKRDFLDKYSYTSPQKIPYAPAVLKKEDPEGYKRYKAYEAYVDQLTEIKKLITPDQVLEYFSSF